MGQRGVRDRLSWEPWPRVRFNIIITNPANTNVALHLPSTTCDFSGMLFFFNINSLNIPSSPTNKVLLDLQHCTGHRVPCASVEPGFRVKDLFVVPWFFNAVVCSCDDSSCDDDTTHGVAFETGCVEGVGLAVDDLTLHCCHLLNAHTCHSPPFIYALSVNTFLWFHFFP